MPFPAETQGTSLRLGFAGNPPIYSKRPGPKACGFLIKGYPGEGIPKRCFYCCSTVKELATVEHCPSTSHDYIWCFLRCDLQQKSISTSGGGVTLNSRLPIRWIPGTSLADSCCWIESGHRSSKSQELCHKSLEWTILLLVSLASWTDCSGGKLEKDMVDIAGSLSIVIALFETEHEYT